MNGDSYQKTYFNVNSGTSVDSDGNALGTSANLYPRATFTNKFIQMVQLFSTGTTKYGQLTIGTQCTFAVDTDWLNSGVTVEMLNTYWTAGTGSEYYHYLPSAPTTVKFNGTAATAGSGIGELNAGEYYYDSDNFRIYVYLSDGSDPSDQDDGYITLIYTNSSGTPLAVFSSSDVFNQTNSWYDEDTGEWRDPDITAGELTWSINANTVSFYNKIGTANQEDTEGFAEICIYLPDSTNVDNSMVISKYILRKTLLNSEEATQIEVTGINFYTKVQTNALVAGRLYQDFSKYDTKTTLVDDDTLATNNSEDSLNPIVVTLLMIWNYILSKIIAGGLTQTVTLAQGDSTSLELGTKSRYLIDFWIHDSDGHYFEGQYSVVNTTAADETENYTCDLNDIGHFVSSTPLTEFDPDNSVGALAAVNSSGTLSLTFTLAAGTDRTLNYRIIN